MIIKMIKELGRRMDAQSDTFDVFNKELENIKKKTEMESPITEKERIQ